MLCRSQRFRDAGKTDLLKIFSVSDYVACRDKKIGSWFIHALCTAVKNSEPRDDIFKVLIKVNHSVSKYKFCQHVNEDNKKIAKPRKVKTDKRKKQISNFWSTFRRQLYLKGDEDEVPEEKRGENKQFSDDLLSKYVGNRYLPNYIQFFLVDFVIR